MAGSADGSLSCSGSPFTFYASSCPASTISQAQDQKISKGVAGAASSSMPAYVIPVAVVFSVVGVALLGFAGYWLFKHRHATTNPTKRMATDTKPESVQMTDGQV